MHWMTGRHRKDYEAMIIERASLQVSVLHLELQIERDAQEIKRLMGEVARERQRADNAVDDLLVVRGINPITPMPPGPREEDPLAEDPDEVDKIEARMRKEGYGSVLAESPSV